MQVPSSAGRIELPDRTRSRLDTFRRRLRLIKIAEGIVGGLFGLLLSYAAVLVIDRFWETPAGVRGLLLVLGMLGIGISFPMICHRWIWKTRRLEQVARLLRHRFPRFGDQLLGIVELAQQEFDTTACSESLLHAAVKQVDDEVAGRDFTAAVTRTKLRRWSWAAGMLTGLVVAALAFAPAAGSNAFLRWLMPWQDTERYTFAQLDELPQDMIVPLAEEFSLSATLADETVWSPARGTAQYGDQRPLESELTGGSYEFQVPPQKEPGTLTLSVGDARRQIDVDPQPRPELTEILAHVTLPEYLRYPHGHEVDLRGGSTSLVEGSRFRVEAVATRDLSTAEMDGVPQQTTGSRIRTEQYVVAESITSELTWQDEVGLTGKRPLVVSIRASQDEPPSLTCGGGAFEQVLLEDDVLSFEMNVSDDFGVQSVGMEWAGIENPYRNPHPVVGEKVLMSGAPEERTLATTATFSAKREGIPPQSLKVKMFAVDFLPGRERSYSPTFILHVLSPEDHAIWLTRQLSKWFRQASEVHEKERQLYETNRRMRSLSADELNRPETRRRIERQAVAESANARRLESVSDAGQRLIQEALKNDQFNPATLETWAEMLNALQQIAGQRMPSVADLLKQAADAPVGAKQGDKKPGAPSESTAKSAPRVGTNRNATPGKAGSPKKGDAPTVPQIADIESGFNEDKSEQPTEEKPPTPAGSSRLTLPVTTLIGGGPPPEQKPPAEPVEEKIAEAVEEQAGLLEEFARVADELQKILDNLEGSTFVKRLKAASRRQMDVANDVNLDMLESFGVAVEQVLTGRSQVAAKRIAERERAQSDMVWVIQSDLEAYYHRVLDGKFKVVLDEMETDNPVAGLTDIGKTVKENRSGQAIASAEFWADTLDRWAEQLVGPACPCNGQCPPGKGESLPPAIILQVMKILEKEINLRDETRALEQTRERLEADLHAERSEALGGTQTEIADLVVEAVQGIEELESAASFFREVALLSRVEQIMREAAGLLNQSETGAPTIAAETEAIELLLQSKRVNPKGGGGGGATPGGGSRGDTEESALALLGSGREENSHFADRAAGQSTGVTGRQVPAEFRAGLDAFFGALEGARELDSE